MPGTGLPVALDNTLTALLTTNIISSWKIVGKGDTTTVILRLNLVDTEMSTNMAEPVLNQTTQVQYFRKKSPSQLKRDSCRAAMQRRQHFDKQTQSRCETDAVLDSPCVLDQPTAQLNKAGQHMEISYDTEQSDDEPDVTLKHDTPALLEDNSCATVSDVFPQPPISDYQQSTDSSVAGFEAAVVKNYVATLTDRSVQRRLRDKHRNKDFRKVASHRSEGKTLLLFETDDIVLEYPYDPNVDVECTYWYVKQEQKNMLKEECDKLAILRKGKRIPNTSLRRETQARAEVDLQAVRGLLVFYLGS